MPLKFNKSTMFLNLASNLTLHPHTYINSFLKNILELQYLILWFLSSVWSRFYRIFKSICSIKLERWTGMSHWINILNQFEMDASDWSMIQIKLLIWIGSELIHITLLCALFSPSNATLSDFPLKKSYILYTYNGNIICCNLKMIFLLI